MTVDETIAILKYFQSARKEDIEESIQPILEKLEYLQFLFEQSNNEQTIEDFIDE